MNPNQAGSPPLQTLVVHLDQLTPENMAQLAQAGYTILRDSNLLIFARPLPQTQELQAVPSQSQADSNGDSEEGVMQLPTRRNV